MSKQTPELQDTRQISQLQPIDNSGAAPLQSSKPEDLTPKTTSLLKYFSGNQEGMDAFLAYCFMVQRVNTGGVSIRELGVIHRIKESLTKDFGLSTSSLKEIVQIISNNTELYTLFATGTSELNYIKEQNPIHLCQILSKYLPENCGLKLSVYLTGDVQEDYELALSVLNLIKSTDVSRLLSIDNTQFQLELTNPWHLIAKHAFGELEMQENTVVIACEHPEQQPDSFFLIKGMVSVVNTISRRKIETSFVEPKNEGVKERPSILDDDLDREDFMRITPDFLSMSQNSGIKVQARTSRIFSHQTIEDSDDIESEAEFLEEDERPEALPAPKRLFNSLTKKISTLTSKRLSSEDGVQSADAGESYGYDMILTQYNGQPASFTGLIWSFVEPEEEHQVYHKIIKQIFLNCAKTAIFDILPNVKNDIRGSWYDPTQGFLMMARYKIQQESMDA